VKAASIIGVLLLVGCGETANREKGYAKAMEELVPHAPPDPKVLPTVAPGKEEPMVGHYVQTADDPPPFPELGFPSPPSGITTVELHDPPPQSVNPLTGPPSHERRDYSAYGDPSHYR
jgi:hypothetical protein